MALAWPRRAESLKLVLFLPGMFLAWKVGNPFVAMDGLIGVPIVLIEKRAGPERRVRPGCGNEVDFRCGGGLLR
jgi:hypothetical protein